MPGYKIHVVWYLILAIPALAVIHHYNISTDFGLSTTVNCLFLGLVYSLIPDIDTPSSKIRSIIGKIFLGVILASLGLYALKIGGIKLIYVSLILAFSLYILWFVKHRGILHTPFAAVIFSVPLYFLKPAYFWFALLGFMSHLMIDGEAFK